MPISGSFSNTSMTFYMLQNFNTHKFFKTWMDAVVNYKDNSMNFYDEYTSTILVYVLNREYVIKLNNIYPIELGAVQLSYGANDQLATVDVTFTFSYWEIV